MLQDWEAKDTIAVVGFVAAVCLSGVILYMAITGSNLVHLGRIALEVLGAVLLAFVLVGVYVLPTLVAARRNMPHVASIAVVNLLLGFTYVGWVVALAMAVAGKRHDQGQEWPASDSRVSD